MVETALCPGQLLRVETELAEGEETMMENNSTERRF